MKKNPESSERETTHYTGKTIQVTADYIPNHRGQKEVAQPFLSDEIKELLTQNSISVKASFRKKGEIHGKAKELG